MQANDDLIEYLKQIMPGVTVECVGCAAKREASQTVVRDSGLYCSEECADRSCAIYRKPQPEGVKAGGYMDV